MTNPATLSMNRSLDAATALAPADRADADPADGAYLTPDALVAYCASRLHTLDDQMTTYFARQKGYRDASAAMNQLQSDLDGIARDPVKGNDDTQWAICGNGDREEKIDGDFERAIAAMPEGKDRQGLIALHDKWKASVDDDHKIGIDEANEMAKEVGNAAKDVGSSAELDMIGLQSLMTQRQTAIQLCTNLVSSLGETSKAIAQKVGA